MHGKLNLLFINTIPIWGGGELWTYQAVREFAERGHTVRVLATDGGTLARKLDAAGLPPLLLPGSFRDKFMAARGLSRALADLSPWIIVANSGPDVRLANRLRRSGLDAVLVFRRGLDKPIQNDFFHRQSMKRIDMILANSEATRRTVHRSVPWFPEARIETVHNPLDAKRFLAYEPRDVRSELGIDPSAYLIGIVGRLSEQKGHETLLRALARVLEELPGTVLLVVGEGERKGKIEGLIARLGLEDACRMVGHADPVQPYYEACDVVAIPSYFEGFCFTAVEAQTLGKPVVASDTSSLPEVIDQGRSGILVPPGDPETLAGALIELGRAPDLRAEMGEAGRSLVLSRFSKATIYDRIEEIFDRLVGRSSATTVAGNATGTPA